MISKKAQSEKHPPLPSQSRQTLEVVPPQGQSLQQEVTQLRREKDALSQIIWSLVQQTSPDTHSAEIPAAVSDPLWALVFVPGSKDGTVKILAGSNPPITESQKKKVIRFLRDTTITIPNALIALKYEFPPAYVEKEILPWLKWEPNVDAQDVPKISGGKWASVRNAGLAEQAMNAFGIPKA